MLNETLLDDEVVEAGVDATVLRTSFLLPNLPIGIIDATNVTQPLAIDGNLRTRDDVEWHPKPTAWHEPLQVAWERGTQTHGWKASSPDHERKQKKSQPTVCVEGAPETHLSRWQTELGQDVDIWSLGCVFVAETWAVLGKDGAFTFHELRSQAIEKLISYSINERGHIVLGPETISTTRRTS